MGDREIQAARWELVEAGGRTAQSFGLSRLFGQIYILLYLSKEPVCLDELATQLSVSKASISISCRQLESWGAVRRAWVRGDRRDFYEAETDFGKLFNSGLLSSLNKKLDSAQRQLERCLSMLGEDGKGEDSASFLRKRLEEAENRRARLSKLINNPLFRVLL